MNIQRLEWDSEFLGFPVAKIPNDITCDEVSKLLQYARLNGVHLVYWSTSVCAFEPSNLSGFASSRIVDQVTFKKRLVSTEKGHITSIEDFSIELWNAAEGGKELFELALQAGNLSRFRLDSRFSAGVFQAMYRIWIDRSCCREIADAVYVIRDCNKVIAGLVTLSLKDQCCSIGLIAVSQAYRRRGIGRVLMQIAEAFARTKNCTEMAVVTQVQNNDATRLYEAAGFVASECMAWFHFWLDEADCAATVL
jgi:dTDP-4-amino-4,6-dideoxy-D-galactose acyltransferase